MDDCSEETGLGAPDRLETGFDSDAADPFLGRNLFFEKQDAVGYDCVNTPRIRECISERSQVRSLPRNACVHGFKKLDSRRILAFSKLSARARAMLQVSLPVSSNLIEVRVQQEVGIFLRLSTGRMFMRRSQIFRSLVLGSAMGLFVVTVGFEAVDAQDSPPLESAESSAPAPDPVLQEVDQEKQQQATEVAGEQAGQAQLERQEGVQGVQDQMEQGAIEDTQNQELESMQEHLDEE